MRTLRSSRTQREKKSRLESLESRRMLFVPTGDPLITEFMASNQGFFPTNTAATTIGSKSSIRFPRRLICFNGI